MPMANSFTLTPRQLGGHEVAELVDGDEKAEK